MIDLDRIRHHIERHILGVLIYQKTARFRDMRPPRVDTNLYSYHLTKLLKSGLVKKIDGGYTLDTAGLLYVDRLNAEKLFVRVQPKIITMLVIQNGYGDVLMYKKRRQPFIERWTLPFGKLHSDDASIADAAQREVKEKIGDYTIDLKHVGDSYIRVRSDQTVITSTLAHVFYGQTDGEQAFPEHIHWIKLRELENYDTAPGIKEIIARTLFRDPSFIEEYDVEWGP